MPTSARSRAWKKLIVALAVVAVGAAGWFFWSRRADQTPEYTTTTIGRGDVIQMVTATGVLQSPTSVNVSSQVSGLIKKLYVDFNSPVKAGQVLADLDPATYQSRVQQAQAQLAQAQASYDLQRLSTDRTKELCAKGLVAQQDLDTAVAQLAQAAAQLQIAQSNLDSAKVDLSRCTISSPIDGIVIDRECDIGNTVAASLNAPTLFTIANDLSKMQIDASVAEADIGNVADGQDVTFTVDAYPNRQFTGKVTQIRNAPKTVSNVVTYDVIIETQNQNQRLKPGMTANVSVIVERAVNALRVANSALRVRLPEDLIPKPPATPEPAAAIPAGPTTAAAAGGSAPTTPAKPLTDQERRAATFQILQEAGFVRGGGPPSAEVIAKAQQLAKDRGLDIDFSRFGGGNRGGGGGATTRTLYRLVGSDPKTATLEAVNVRLGITDGIYTAVLNGLKEGDILVTGVTVGGGTATASQATANPFTGRGAGPGGGPRRF
ncbi:MAG TPA: efflux RND transporter periplasmic adaptor subunit [Opitutaceae bacterium]|nr:efflux RND transporter periplasmic adaptor subunit [Opitutaceae bacterium]